MTLLATINPLTGRPFLNHFLYCPIFVELTPSENKLYNKYSQQIAIMKAQDDYDPNDLQKLYDRRAAVSKNAEEKYEALNVLLEKLNPEKIVDTILFVSDKQIKKSFDILSDKHIKRAKITEQESASKIVNSGGDTERQEIISQFNHRQLQFLVGIKCLDEGIDIPNARIAILMSSSTNPREFVQRVGRVIRQAEGKQISEIYDFIATSDSADGLLKKESQRAQLIAVNADNYKEVKEAFSQRGVNLDANQ